MLAIMGKSAMKDAGHKFHATRCKLKREVNWDDWLEAKKKQLDEMDKYNMYGEPIKPPINATIL
eukprot:3102559-Ditylum_brightwellii.AAC.1